VRVIFLRFIELTFQSIKRLTCSRLTRLERTVSALVERLDNGGLGWAPNANTASTSPIQPPPAPVHEAQTGTPSAAPVFLIRDVATEVGMQRHHVAGLSQNLDIVSSGLITVQDASSLIELSVFPSDSVLS
jgi:hypothetical protein